MSRVVTDLSALNLFLTCEDSRTHSQQIDELQQQIDQLVKHLNTNKGGKFRVSRHLTKSRNLNMSVMDVTAGSLSRMTLGFSSVTPLNCIEMTEGSQEANFTNPNISKTGAENKA